MWRSTWVASGIVMYTLLVIFPVAANPVTFNDNALLTAVKTQWEAATGLILSDPPEDTELANPLFTTLVAKELGITDLTGLEACTSLTALNLGRNQISVLTPLSGLTNLETLDLGMGTDPLMDGMPMDYHETGSNLITDISPLAGLANLEYLSLMGNAGLTNIASVSTMDSLTQLWLASTPISDFSPLSGIADTLSLLALINTGLHNSDLGAVNTLTNLSLGLVIIAEPNLTDISALTDINPGFILVLMQTPLTDISVVSLYTHLQRLQVAETNATAIPDLSGLASLQSANLYENSFTDISGLTNASSIQLLNLKDNAISDISALSTCTGLQRFSLEGNQITDIQPLLDNPNAASFLQIDLSNNPFVAGTPFCEEHQLDQLETLAPGAEIKQNAICGILHTLTLLVNGPGTTDPAPGEHLIEEGIIARVNPLPNPGYAFDHWEGDIGNADPYAQNLQILMDQDRVITAFFVLADWFLTLQTTGNGLISPAPEVHGYIHGASVQLNSLLISGGDAFSHWSGDIGTANAEDTAINVVMDRNRTVIANFVSGEWTLTLATAGNPKGITSPAPGVYAYLNNQWAYLGIYRGPNAYFAGWSGDVSQDNPNITMLMDSNKIITANFDSAGFVLEVNVEGQGSTTLNGASYFASGLEPTLTATPQNDYVFDHWSGDLPASANPNDPELLVLMDQDRSLTAHFIINPAILTIIIEGQGLTNPPGGPAPGVQYTYILGQQVVVSAALGTVNWAFSHWSGDIGASDTNNMNLQLAMDRDRTIVANYVAADWTLTVDYTGNGSTWPEPGIYGYLDGTSVEAVANILNGGDAFDHWDGVLEGMNSLDPGQRFNIHGNMTLTAVFTPGDHTLTTTVTGGGSAEYISHPTGIYQYVTGRNANLEVRPSSSTFWGGYSGDVNSFDYSYSLLMDDNKNVTITLGTSGYQLEVNQVGFGLTNPSGIAGFVAGATPDIHAIDQGSALFDYWSGDLPAGVDPTNRDPEILMDQNRTLTANFVEADFYLYIQVIGNGTTDPAPALYWHRNSDAFTVTATPEAEFLFLQWQGNVPSGQDPASPAISGTIDQNVELIAVFVPASVIVPDLTEKTQAQAEAALAALGLILGEISHEYSDTVLADQVISQNPAAETSVAYGGTVSIVVSLGPCVAPVPNLEGFTQAEAETALASAHLTLGAVTQENSASVPEGRVIRQDPVFGLSVACDTSVAVVISLGPVIEGEGEGDEGELEGESGCHTADQNCDGLVNLSELLRVIQFFNSGGYHCQAGTEDGYAPGPASDKGLQPLVLRQITKVDCLPHSSDYVPQDWLINLSELLRLIQFFNSGGYHACPGEGTEDGFCPGVR